MTELVHPPEVVATVNAISVSKLGEDIGLDLARVVLGETSLSKAGYPFIAQQSFDLFLARIPHIFRDGLAVVECTATVREQLKRLLAEDNQSALSIARALKVIDTVTYTAAITAPSDLWLMRHILSSHQKLGLSDLLMSEGIEPEETARSLGLDAKILALDLQLLCSRGLLGVDAGRFHVAARPQAQDVYARLKPLEPAFKDSLVPLIVASLDGDTSCIDRLDKLLTFDQASLDKREGWPPTTDELELGFRIVPLVLALRLRDIADLLTEGASLIDAAPNIPAAILQLCKTAALIDHEGTITRLGARVFAKGPGPMGIIHAYHGYMENHIPLLRGNRDGIWVARGENVGASQDANARTFALANDAIDQFCKDYAFGYSVFIEHAVGMGEATRQRFARSGEESIQYFGADLEDAAIDRARAEQRKGNLPHNMLFVPNADIGEPSVLIRAITDYGFSTRGAVMVVGNGFHEVRNQTNARMIEVFRQYCEAGILIVFTEETGLADTDLLATGWNTYHAGFRYVHAMSGQGLRPARERPEATSDLYSWRRCAREAGYEVMEKYLTRTRTIYPVKRPDGSNPAISVNYFCVPKSLLP